MFGHQPVSDTAFQPAHAAGTTVPTNPGASGHPASSSGAQLRPLPEIAGRGVDTPTYPSAATALAYRMAAAPRHDQMLVTPPLNKPLELHR
jgi:hypothetical protein